MSRIKEGWYVGRYKGDLSEICYGYLVAGYYSFGGTDNETYSHDYWGLVWAGDYTLGIGRIKRKRKVDLTPVTGTGLYRGLDDNRDTSIQRGLAEFEAGQFADAPSMDDRDWLEEDKK